MLLFFFLLLTATTARGRSCCDWQSKIFTSRAGMRTRTRLFSKTKTHRQGVWVWHCEVYEPGLVKAAPAIRFCFFLLSSRVFFVFLPDVAGTFLSSRGKRARGMGGGRGWGVDIDPIVPGLVGARIGTRSVCMCVCVCVCMLGGKWEGGKRRKPCDRLLRR